MTSETERPVVLIVEDESLNRAACTARRDPWRHRKVKPVPDGPWIRQPRSILEELLLRELDLRADAVRVRGSRVRVFASRP